MGLFQEFRCTLRRFSATFLTLFAVGFLHPRLSYSTPIVTDPLGYLDSYGLSPFWEWKTLETEHFRITFPAELQSISVRASRYLEETHTLLAPLIKWQPFQKTQILVIDNTDSANGLTSPLARFGIILWGTPPDSEAETGYYDDWLRLLCLHEYTHFLNMDTTEGPWSVLRNAFGNLLLPNAVWPPWMLEGLAVYMETRFTNAGRGRSPVFEMMLRTAANEGILGESIFVPLDRLTGTNPYYPFGDTHYQFGYHLLNQLSLSGDPNSLRHNDELTGNLSKNSGHRIPFFINENAKNISGKNWYQLWSDFLALTRQRVEKEIQQLRKYPLTQAQFLTSNHPLESETVSGLALSPQGDHLVYTLASSDRRQGLYLHDLKSGERSRLIDKMGGVGIKFTPDSEDLIYSRLHQIGQFYTYSDLEVLSLKDRSSYWLTFKLRTRDPDISSDGQWITFTLTDHGVTGLAIAPLIKENGRYQLGKIERIFMPKLFDRVSNPKFSASGAKIYFSLHPNGQSQEDILIFNRETGKVQTLLSDHFYNRLPVPKADGSVYFISNKTGVNNIYRIRQDGAKPELLTNVVTGIDVFTFDKDENTILGTVFTTRGWKLARYALQKPNELPQGNLAAVTLDPPPFPKAETAKEVSKAETKDETSEYSKVREYSIFPSIYPRVWGPLAGFDSKNLVLGAQLAGFDATDQHRYSIAATYSRTFNTADAYLFYSNRTLGPTLGFEAAYLTDYSYETSTATAKFSRDLSFSTTVSYPFLWTYSALTPAFSFNIERLYNYSTSTDFTNSTFSGASPIVPDLGLTLNFSTLEYSTLALIPEGGSSSTLGVKVYLTPQDPVWKFLVSQQDYFKVLPHVILTPSVRGIWTSRSSSPYAPANALLQGRIPQSILNSFAGNDIDQLSIRGYPGFLNLAYQARAAAVGALDLYFPIVRVFRGLGTHPAYFNNLYAFIFAELSYFPYQDIGFTLPSAGGGVRLTTEAFFVPILFSTEFHQGFRSEFGGTSDLFFQIRIQGLRF